MGTSKEPSSDSSIATATVRKHMKTSPEKSRAQLKAITNLLLRHRVVHQHQVRQLLETLERIQVRQLAQVVRRQLQVRQVRYRIGQRGLYADDTVPGEEQRPYAGRQWEVAKGQDVVVGKVDGILRTGDTQVLNGWY